MRVGVYVDAFNLYYGAKEMMGSTAGWRWLDIRKLAERYAQWGGASVDRVVYCTARVNDADDPSQARRQGFYLDALCDSGSVDVLEEGYYSSWAKESVMTNEPPGQQNPTPLLDKPRRLRWSSDLRLRRSKAGVMLATVRKREEKGSDVNVATHLLHDVLTRAVDAAIVVSNDSDLALPLHISRSHVPTGLLNPGTNRLAGALQGRATEGPGGTGGAELRRRTCLIASCPTPWVRYASHRCGDTKRPALT